MDLETVVHCEVSQKEKNKYCVLTHICGIQKSDTNEPTCRTGIETEMQRMDMCTWRGKEGWDKLGD